MAVANRLRGPMRSPSHDLNTFSGPAPVQIAGIAGIVSGVSGVSGAARGRAPGRGRQTPKSLMIFATWPVAFTL